VTDRPPTAHLHSESRQDWTPVAGFFYQSKGPPREQTWVDGYVSDTRPMSKSMMGLPAAKVPVFEELTCP
jgi:hypothetical protein